MWLWRAHLGLGQEERKILRHLLLQDHTEPLALSLLTLEVIVLRTGARGAGLKQQERSFPRTGVEFLPDEQRVFMSCNQC